MRPHPRLTHSDYYRDRSSESELCYDFPGDDIFIDGLHAMQMHFWSNNRNIDIPVVRVMNAAHFIAAYMLQTSCSGDQWEYDTLVYVPKLRSGSKYSGQLRFPQQEVALLPGTPWKI